MKKLVDNYEKRIKNFVLKLAEHPIIVKKNKDKYLTSREEFYANNSNKIIDKKGFSFKFYKTEKERINEYIKEKNKIDKYISRNIKPKRKKTPEIKLIQPSMRFKARTDLERVYDVLKTRESMYNDKKIVQNQLNQMGFVSKNVEEEEEDDEDEEEKKQKVNVNNEDIIKNEENLNEEEKKRKILHNKIIQDRKNMIERRKFFLSIGNKKRMNNSNANSHIKHLREDLHQKLHFKAMENLSMFKTSTVNHNLFKIWSEEDIKTQKNINFNKNMYYAYLSNGFSKAFKSGQNVSPYRNRRNARTNSNKYIKTKANNNENDILFQNFIKSYNKKKSGIINANKIVQNQKKFNIFKNKKILEDMDLTKEIINSNPLLYNVNFYGKKNSSQNKEVPQSQLSSLKEMAFIDNREENSEEFNNMKFDNQFDDLKKEENVVIDGKTYNKNETYKIADKVLKKCNWNRNKVRYDGNFGKGKLMFTNGMTLQQFEEKYNLIP